MSSNGFIQLVVAQGTWAYRYSRERFTNRQLHKTGKRGAGDLLSVEFHAVVLFVHSTEDESGFLRLWKDDIIRTDCPSCSPKWMKHWMAIQISMIMYTQATSMAQLHGSVPGRIVVLSPERTFKLRDPLDPHGLLENPETGNHGSSSSSTVHKIRSVC